MGTWRFRCGGPKGTVRDIAPPAWKSEPVAIAIAVPHDAVYVATPVIAFAALKRASS